MTAKPDSAEKRSLSAAATVLRILPCTICFRYLSGEEISSIEVVSGLCRIVKEKNELQKRLDISPYSSKRGRVVVRLQVEERSVS